MSVGRRSSILAALCTFSLSIPLSAQNQPTPDDQACAVFTRAGTSLLATVRGSQVSLTLGSSPQPFLFTLPAITQPADRATGSNTCVLALNTTEDEAAIGVPLTPDTDTALAAVEVARFSLTRRSWQPPVTVTPPPPLASLLHGRYRNAMRLLGYQGDSTDLILAASDQRLTSLTEDGQQSPAPANLDPSLFETPSSTSLTHSRFWSSCDQNPTAMGKASPCSLFATALFGNRVIAPRVLSPLVRPQPHVVQWAKPVFYADLGQSLVFASSESAGLQTSYALWIANLNDASIHQVDVPARFNDTGLTGQFAVSTDGAILAFTIGRSRMQSRSADGYVSLGDRIVVVDLAAHKLSSEIRPINSRSALALAVHHTAGKTTLLVDWGNGWQPEALP